MFESPKPQSHVTGEQRTVASTEPSMQVESPLAEATFSFERTSGETITNAESSAVKGDTIASEPKGNATAQNMNKEVQSPLQRVAAVAQSFKASVSGWLATFKAEPTINSVSLGSGAYKQVSREQGSVPSNYVSMQFSAVHNFLERVPPYRRMIETAHVLEERGIPGILHGADKRKASFVVPSQTLKTDQSYSNPSLLDRGIRAFGMLATLKPQALFDSPKPLAEWGKQFCGVMIEPESQTSAKEANAPTMYVRDLSALPEDLDPSWQSAKSLVVSNGTAEEAVELKSLFSALSTDELSDFLADIDDQVEKIVDTASRSDRAVRLPEDSFGVVVAANEDGELFAKVLIMDTDRVTYTPVGQTDPGAARYNGRQAANWSKFLDHMFRDIHEKAQTSA